MRRVVAQPATPELPGAFVAYSAEVADTRRFAPWTADRYAFGASLGNEKDAQAAAIGEAVERYCGNAPPSMLRQASYDSLAAAGESAVHPADWVLYSANQYAARGFSFVPMTTDLPLRWVAGLDLTADQPVLVPASLVYLNFRHGQYASEPPTNGVILPGIAAGRSRAEAECNAIAEVVERDAVTLWWQQNAPTVGVRWRSSPQLRALMAPRNPSSRLDFDMFAVPNEFEAPVVGALLRDPDLDIVTMGSSCRADPLAAMEKALVEAIQLRAFSVDLLDTESRIWRGAQGGLHDSRCFFAYRPDRSYLNCVSADFGEADDFAMHAQLYLDPRMRGYLRRIRSPSAYVDPGQVRGLVGDERSALLSRLIQAGRRVISVDVTTSDIAAIGIRVVRVLIPGLYPNGPASLPFLGGSRLYRSCTDGSLLMSDELVRAPIPAI